MATLTVWKFATADGAAGTVETLQRLQRQELIKVFDAAIVSWPQGARKPKTQQLNSLVGVGALGGMFWGLLFGPSSSFRCSAPRSAQASAPSAARSAM